MRGEGMVRKKESKPKNSILKMADSRRLQDPGLKILDSIEQKRAGMTKWRRCGVGCNAAAFEKSPPGKGRSVHGRCRSQRCREGMAL